jgi:copper transport protein
MRVVKHGLALAAAVGLFVAAAPHPAMHLRLVNAEPGINGSTDKVPAEIRLFYSQAPQMEGTTIRLLTEAQKEIPLEATKADEKDKKIVFATLKEKIGLGTYTVAWRAMAADGHVLRDEFTFTLKAATGN